MPQTLTPCVTDNDNGKITVTLDDRELRGWSYASDDERRQKMKMAREYVEGWCDASNTLRPQLDAANEKLNLANTGGLSLLYDIRRELGWNDKTSLSILPSGVRRVRHALQTWDTPSDMDLESLARAVKGRVVELERIRAEDKIRQSPPRPSSKQSGGRSMKITTSFDHPPIPDRSMDWSAIDSDTYDCDCDQDGFFSLGPIGRGATEAEAIADLLEKMEDQVDAAPAHD